MILDGTLVLIVTCFVDLSDGGFEMMVMSVDITTNVRDDQISGKTVGKMIPIKTGA